jgi:hypothetical protein
MGVVLIRRADHGTDAALAVERSVTRFTPTAHTPATRDLN